MRTAVTEGATEDDVTTGTLAPVGTVDVGTVDAVAGAPTGAPSATPDGRPTPDRRSIGSLSDGRPVADGGPLSKEAVVAQLFDCFSRRDVESALTLLHPNVVFQPMTAEVTRAGEPYRGHHGIRCYVEDVEAHWQRLVVNPTQIRAAGRAVVVLGLVSGAGPGGSFADVPTTWVLKFTDGRVAHAQIFADARHVNEALGVACVSASATELS